MTQQLATRSDIDAAQIAAGWLERARTAVKAGDSVRFAQLFTDAGYWRDLLAFSGDYRTFAGTDAIERAFAATHPQVQARDVRLAVGRMAPRLLKRGGRRVVEFYFDFETLAGQGTGFVRLLLDPDVPQSSRAVIGLTALQQLHGHEEQIGDRRPTGTEWSYAFGGNNWLDRRIEACQYDDRDPEVLIIGGGQAGLTLAARLRVMGVDALIVEKNARIGDNWRHRYHSLTLHNEAWANHLPYVPFPDSWPTFVPKDKLADFLESYAGLMELNVWTGATVGATDYDADAGTWSVDVTRADGTRRLFEVAHLVIATGSVSGVPKVGGPSGLEDFCGEVMHSSRFTSGLDYRNKRAIVVGTGNSGHDVAQELHSNGAHVTMVQRHATCVVSLVPSGTMVYALYQEGPVDDIDLITASIPYPVLRDTYQWMTRKTCELDAPLLTRLEAAGFETEFGEDGTGFHMKYLRTGGGYYINVGCSDLIADGSIELVNTREIAGFSDDAMLLQDGSCVPADVVVLATGYENQREGLRRLLGDDVAERVGEIWGFDEDGFMRNMWTRTGQPHLWLMGGALNDCRLFSRFLALRLVADLRGAALPDPTSSG